MFRRVLIANRGEIAVRILRACRELGVETVAVYSDVDRSALHVRYADAAYYIGPAPARDSYLRIDRLIETAQKSGADAIHPGYGFLSENPDFAAACEEESIAFVGPPSGVIAAMGDKVAARQLMQAVGVPIVPGTHKNLSDDEILGQAGRVGFPLFIKAAAGGGGKGMRLVHGPDELERSLGAARRESANAFGDDRVYLERAVQRARHVEIQILADGYGNLIHLGERDCSIQRRHQKLIEESPSPALESELRQRMGEMAVRAAEAGGYVNAGTVEFLLDDDGRFYFLEMNTRLQVEHPVTESVTGVDIVKEQLRVASGERLSYAQQDVRMSGWAIECRITAEDPANDFLPSGGRITGLSQPSGPGVRIDSGIYEGFVVSAYYDSLLAKLVVWGRDRRETILRMRRALREFRIIGVETSIPFHKQVMETSRFIDGSYDTAFIKTHLSMEMPYRQEQADVAAIAAVLLHHQRRGSSLAVPVPHHASSFNPWRVAGRREGVGR